MQSKLSIYIFIIIALSGCGQKFSQKEKDVFNEFDRIINEGTHPRLPVSEIRRMLDKIEPEEYKYVGVGANEHYRFRFTLANRYWDWGCPNDAWYLLKDFHPSDTYQSGPTLDISIWLGIAVGANRADIQKVISNWIIAKQKPLLSSFAIDCLLNQDFSCTFKEFIEKFDKEFSVSCINAFFHELTDSQARLMHNIVFLMRVYQHTTTHDQEGLRLAGLLVEKVFKLYSLHQLHPYPDWTSIQFELMHIIIFILNSAAQLHCPPFEKNNNSIWIKRYKEVKALFPPNLPIFNYSEIVECVTQPPTSQP
jgi:hypothetical protein